MRHRISAALTAALLIGVSAARAAPTCLNDNGLTIRCGVAGARPVGWTPSPDRQWARETSQDPGPTVPEAVAMLYVVGSIFALIALMPPFDGAKDGDWDEQEGDRERRPHRRNT